MRYRTVVIGLGTIARYHVMGIRQSENFDLCAVCDLREETAQDPLWASIPFYRDYTEMLETIRPDVAIIATPPDTHYSISRACVERNILPFVEKPLAAAKTECEQFLSKDMSGQFVPICHTIYGQEMLWLIEHLSFQNIASIRMTLCDPYADKNGHIAERFQPLGGSWLDSAPNALAPLLRIVPRLENVVLQHMRDERNGIPYASKLTAQYNATNIVFDIDWHRGINHKQTEIEADGKHILIDHSAQMVKVNNQVVFCAETDRLTQQYANFYSLYPARVPNDKMLKEMYRIIWIND